MTMMMILCGAAAIKQNPFFQKNKRRKSFFCHYYSQTRLNGELDTSRNLVYVK